MKGKKINPLFITIFSLALILISTTFLFSQQEWIVYNTRGEYIICLAEEGEYLWVGTLGGGLVKLNKATGDFIVYDKWNSPLPDNDVLAIAIDGDGNKWIGTLGGLAKFDGVNSVFVNCFGDYVYCFVQLVMYSLSPF